MLSTETKAWRGLKFLWLFPLVTGHSEWSPLSSVFSPPQIRSGQKIWPLCVPKCIRGHGIAMKINFSVSHYVCLPYMHSFVWTCLCVWMCTWSLCRCIHTMTILSSSNVCDVSFYFVIHCVCVDAHVCSGVHFILWDVCCVGICFSCCTV